MENNKIDWSQWYLFAIGVVVVECVSIYLLMHAYPGHEMKVTGGAILTLVVGFAGYATYKASEPDTTVRRVGIAGKVVLALLGVAALWGHSSMSRELSTARAADTEYRKRLKLQSDTETEQTNRLLALKQAETEQMVAQTKLEQAEARKLGLLYPSQRGAGAGNGRKKLPQPPAAPPAKTADTPNTQDQQQDAPKPPKLESEVRQDWMSFFQVVNFLQILVSVLGALGVNVARHWDKAGIIGVPDFIERIWYSGINGQAYIRANYTQYVPYFEGAVAQPGTMGNSMA